MMNGYKTEKMVNKAGEASINTDDATHVTIDLSASRDTEAETVPGGDHSQWTETLDSDQEHVDQSAGCQSKTRSSTGQSVCSKIAQIGSPSHEHTANEHTNTELKQRLEVAACTSAQLHTVNDHESSTNQRALAQRATSVDQMEQLMSTQPSHVFIMSDAGKPIYSRHGNESSQSALFGLMHTLHSFVLSQSPCANDQVQLIRHAHWLCVYLYRPPLLYIGTCKSQSAHRVTVWHSALRTQLLLLHRQIISILTRTQLVKIFENRPNFDLRGLLSGTDKVLDNMYRLGQVHAGVMLDGMLCKAVAVDCRQLLQQAILQAHSQLKIKNVVFALVLVRGQLVSMVSLRKYSLSPADLHLIVNLIDCNESLRNASTWLPLCLPHFDDTGFLHAHISYLEEGSDACLMLLTVDRNAFFELNKMRDLILERLAKNKIVPQVSQIFEKKIAIAGLWHFLYKNRYSGQVCSAPWQIPFVHTREQLQLMTHYKRVIERVHQHGPVSDQPCKTQGQGLGEGGEAHKPLRIYYQPLAQYTILAWVTASFELYSVFNPLTNQQTAIAHIDKLMKWLKSEEDVLFVLNTLHF